MLSNICGTFKSTIPILRRNMSSGIPKAPTCGHHHAANPEKEPAKGPIEEGIVAKIREDLQPTYFKIRNDSWMHRGHRAMQGAGNLDESHFSMVVISDKFKELRNLPSRHRYVYKLLDDELQNKGVHAIQMKLKTPEEWSREVAREKGGSE